MTFWDDTNTVTTFTTKKQIYRAEISGDIDGNFTFRAHIQKIIYDNGVEIAREELAEVSTTYNEAMLDATLEPLMTKLKNGARSLVRTLVKI